MICPHCLIINRRTKKETNFVVCVINYCYVLSCSRFDNQYLSSLDQFSNNSILVYKLHTLLSRPEPEPVFVDLLRSPRIDSRPGGPVRQPYLSYRPARLHRLAKSIPRNRFLSSIHIYKYGL